MPSPFPGMDPYIEQPSLWGDFHNNLASEIQALLNRQIRPDYFARLIPYVTYETVAIGQREQTYPDVSVFQPKSEADLATRGRRYTPITVVESVSVESEVDVDFPLPVVPVPLLAPDDDVLLDLGQAVTSVYERGAYDLQLNYRAEPPPPKLTEEEAQWIANRLASIRSR